jgi:hypothetical protein
VGGIKVSDNGSIMLRPGLYYLKGGGLAVSGYGTVTGEGVTIYNDAHVNGDAISFTGNASVHLNPSKGGTY